jgi:hydrogenase/urease accessory protein HupE
MKKYSYLFFATLLLILFCLPAHAHWADMSAMELNIDDKGAEATLTLPTRFLISADKNNDGKISPVEITRQEKFIKSLLSDDVYLKGDGVKGDLSISPSETQEINVSGPNNQSTLHLSWKWQKSPVSYKLHYSLFPPEAVNAHCLVSAAVNNQVKTIVFDQKHNDEYLKELTTLENIRQFLMLGIEHIATGYDHILFLIALLLAGGRFTYLIKIVTAFTLAHSITLSLAVLGIVTVPSRFVESCIAASIIYVAAENLWRKKDEAHWILVFIFGLVHGLGFASVLREMEIPRNQLAITLATFNIGIELGQITIVVSAWYLLTLMRKTSWSGKIKNAGSVAIVAMASVWFIQRAFLGL